MRMILAGRDEQLLPLLERLRPAGEHEVVGLGSTGAASLTALYSEIMGLPLLEETPVETWQGKADLLVSDGIGVERLPGMPRRGLSEMHPFLDKKSEPQAAAAAPQGEQVAAVRSSGSAYCSFPRELQREIHRSKRYHLGFCLTLLRLEDGKRRPLDAKTFEREPLRGFPARVGRVTDSWGLSEEGIMLHLAPETLEQAKPMRRRLVSDLLAASRDLQGGPWRVYIGQALYPQDGEEARELIDVAFSRLERNPGEGEDEA